MRTARLVTAPDGSRWSVGRRWMTRPAPKLWRGLNMRRRVDVADSSWLNPLDLVPSGADDLLAGIVFVVAAVLVIALVVFVLLPLIGLAIELALLIGLFSSGLFGRIFLGRPWIVAATSVDRPHASSTFPVKGWRRSRRAIRQLAAAIETNGVPLQLAEAEAE